jgi:hypothetical protein
LNCDSLVPKYDQSSNPIYTLQSNYSVEKSNIIWRIVTGYASDERRKNVERILNFSYSPIKVMAEFKGDGDNCSKLLNEENIRINPKYFDGSGLIQIGKVGHWCSFLNFLKVLNFSTAEIGIWIEDDADLKPEHLDKIKSFIYSKEIKPSHPMTRVSIADTVLVIQKSGIQSLWDPIVKFGILYPTDIYYKNLGLVMEKDLQIPRVKTVNSTISSTISLNISDLNRIIDKSKKKKKQLIDLKFHKNFTKMANVEKTKRRRPKMKKQLEI